MPPVSNLTMCYRINFTVYYLTYTYISGLHKQAQHYLDLTEQEQSS